MNLNTPEIIENYDLLKSCLENIYQHITKGKKIRSRCQSYEDREKLTKFFLNHEKVRATKITIKMLENKGEDIMDQNLINNAFENFYKTFFQKTIWNQDDKLNNFFK